MNTKAIISSMREFDNYDASQSMNEREREVLSMVETTKEQAEVIRRRNMELLLNLKWLIESPQEFIRGIGGYNEFGRAKVTVEIGCPHCHINRVGTFLCQTQNTICAWARMCAQYNKKYGTCHSLELACINSSVTFYGISLCKTNVDYRASSACIRFWEYGDQQVYRNSLRYLIGHILWADSILDAGVNLAETSFEEALVSYNEELMER